MRGNLEFREYSKMIREHFFQHRLSLDSLATKELEGCLSNVGYNVGKSHTQVQLKQIYGRENVYVWTDLIIGGLDLYCV